MPTLHRASRTRSLTKTPAESAGPRRSSRTHRRGHSPARVPPRGRPSLQSSNGDRLCVPRLRTNPPGCITGPPRQTRRLQSCDFCRSQPHRSPDVFVKIVSRRRRDALDRSSAIAIRWRCADRRGRRVLRPRSALDGIAAGAD